ncbi:mechanosensitive ion channel domain-containing protein [Oricola cellulosilytica]|uniref:Mechanosensitive ion channel n=1 Tax=Oricola cellulosilytica TaxID=1429082 RepID=A0A4R0PAJ4_9HYPH|nr:mechanosensitive ion channel domain-containing protein [Oricola cellulosilytica]TCD14056.1 mechanosensitive ion channel [Oricola cellulosilytica]
MLATTPPFRFLVLVLSVCLAAAMVPASAQSLFTSSDGVSAETAPEVGSAIDTLVDIIKDDAARAELIERLEGLQAEEQAASGPEAATQSADSSLVRSVAEATTGMVQGAYASVQQVWRDLRGIETLFATLPDEKRRRMNENALPLLGTIVATVLVFWLASFILARLIQPQKWIRAKTRAVRATLTVLINLLADGLALAIAYAAGNVIAITAFGGGLITVEQSLYLNAFLVAGAVGIVIRLFVRPRRPDHALLNLSQPVQATAYRWLSLIAGLLVYGLTVAVPIANLWTTFLFGRSLRLIVVTLAAGLAIFAIRQVSRMIREDALAQPAEGTPPQEPADAEAGDRIPLWQKLWPPLAYFYVAVCYVIAVVYPALMGDLIGGATVRTVIAGALVALAFRFIGTPARARIAAPAWLEHSLPGFGGKLNVFMPLIFRIVAVFVVLAAMIYVLDAWRAIDVESLLGRDQALDLSGRFMSAILIIAGVLVVWALVVSWIDNRLTLDLPGKNVTARTRTLLSLFKNAFSVVAVVFGSMMALSQLGIDIAPLLAGAGVIGLAIGFGAQKLVQDIITGIFIQLENAINEGDVVTVAGTTGAVEKLTIRSVGVRDLNGVYHIVPFSAVDTVSNFMKRFAYHVAEIGVAYKEHVPAVKEAMEEAFERLKATEHGASISGPFEMQGVVALADSSVNIRARIKTRPGQQWAVGRAYTEIVKGVFDEKGIEIPYPHRVYVRPPEEPQPATIEKQPAGKVTETED